VEHGARWGRAEQTVEAPEIPEGLVGQTSLELVLEVEQVGTQ
jgi:hypothetical protein